MKVAIIATIVGVTLSGSGWVATNTIDSIDKLDAEISTIKSESVEDMKYIIDRIDRRLELSEDRIDERLKLSEDRIISYINMWAKK